MYAFLVAVVAQWEIFGFFQERQDNSLHAKSLVSQNRKIKLESIYDLVLTLAVRN